MKIIEVSISSNNESSDFKEFQGVVQPCLKKKTGENIFILTWPICIAIVATYQVKKVLRCVTLDMKHDSSRRETTKIDVINN